MAVAASLAIGRRETVVEATARALIDYIGARGLRPGDRLPSERELVVMTGVSRLPLREALGILKGLGIVEAQHGRGVFVLPMDPAAVFRMLSPLLRTQADLSAADIVAARLGLEPVLARLAALHRTDADLAALEAALQGMRDRLADQAAFIEHDMAFHQGLAKATGNPIFQVVLAAITDLVRHVQYLFPDRIELRRASIEHHQSILEAVRSGAGEAAAGAMEAHIRNVEERL